MHFSTLADSAFLYKDTIKLIESSFKYDSHNSFEIDFYPLVHKNNTQNCHLLINDNNVIGHIGVLQKKLKVYDHFFEISFIGGIAIDEEYRGRGLFRSLINHVLSKYDNSFFLLWSDKLDLYMKLSFYPCIEMFEEENKGNKTSHSYTKTPLDKLSVKDFSQIKNLYSQISPHKIERTDEDWDILKKISSSSFYIKKIDGQITNYFFKNKGQDLQETIHETAVFSESNDLLNYGKLWSPSKISPNSQALYQSLLRIGNVNQFSKFIEKYTQGKIQVTNITSNQVDFLFENSSITLPVHEFLTGVLGPNKFEELSETLPIFISGLDSI